MNHRGKKYKISIDTGKYTFLINAILLFGLYGCVEEFELESVEDFENILVVEAILTDDDSPQEILLSRTYELEEEGPKPESDAKVKIVDDSGFEYVFNETESGKYISDDSFELAIGENYQLYITTKDGSSYESEQVQLAPPAQLDSLYAERIVNDQGIEGVAIFIDSSDPIDEAKFFRYTYEETYKIITPFVANQELEIITEEPFEAEVIDRIRDRVCYMIKPSDEILIANTLDFSYNRIIKYLIKFFPFNAFEIRTRYTIVVNQFTQSFKSDNFYALLDKFSDLENLFTQAQPGAIPGNISAINSSKRVVGLFEISSVEEKRIFFSYEDFFPEFEIPSYIVSCEPFAPLLSQSPFVNPYVTIINAIKSEDVLYYLPNENPRLGEGPYLFIDKICGDCTELGTAVVPDFWID